MLPHTNLQTPESLQNNRKPARQVELLEVIADRNSTVARPLWLLFEAKLKTTLQG